MRWNCIIDTKSYKSIVDFCHDTPSIKCEILQRQYVPVGAEHPERPLPVEEVVEAPPTNPTPSLAQYRFKCSTCEAGFATSQEHREHFRSDWHRYNLKRKN